MNEINVSSGTCGDIATVMQKYYRLCCWKLFNFCFFFHRLTWEPGVCVNLNPFFMFQVNKNGPRDTWWGEDEHGAGETSGRSCERCCTSARRANEDPRDPQLIRGETWKHAFSVSVITVHMERYQNNIYFQVVTQLWGICLCLRHDCLW